MVNGSYWYNTPSRSIGFSPDGSINQNECDVNGSEYEKRLCWHLLNWVGGWRLGGVNEPLNDSHDYVKAVFKDNPPTPLHKGSKTNGGSLSRIVKLSIPAGGSVGLSVSDDSSGACRVVDGKVYAFANGLCKVTVSALKSNGDVRASVTKKFLVG